MAIERILVPVDFSEYSERAVAFALELARPCGARVQIFHCYSELVGGKAPVGSAGLDPAMEQDARTRLEQLVERSSPEGVEIDLELHAGLYPAEVVVERARHATADLIVMGTHGRSGVKRAVFGSVAEQVVREAPCPVATVKAG